ncbi:hypothetical protein CHUAL_001617 [Chamberlinius hualienensis]
MSARVKLEPGCSSGGNHLVEHMTTSQRICYVCGGIGAAYSLNTRPRDIGSYFPFLEQHEIPHGASRPDANGAVISCLLCFSVLSQQWESYERSRTPHYKRLYWLKRTDGGHYIGAEMKLQGEYASQVIGISPEPGGSRGQPVGQHGNCFPMINSPALASSSRQSTPVSRLMLTQPVYSNLQTTSTTSNTASNQEYYRDRPNSGTTFSQMVAANHHNEDSYESASILLDLRSGSGSGGGNLLKARDGRQQGEQMIKSEITKSSETHVGNGALDLSMPDKNAATEVCYLCGDEVPKGTLVNIYAKEVANCPYFPSLFLYSRPSRSHPIDHSGCVQSCGPCHQYLLQQWDSFQRQNVPHTDRHYRLRKHSNSVHYYSPSPRMPVQAIAVSPHTSTPMPQLPPPSVSSHHSNAFICFLCGQEFPWNQRRVLYSGPNAEGEQPLPFLERFKPSRGALPLSATGEALTCSNCYKAAHKQRHVYVDSLRNNAAAEEQHSRSQHQHTNQHHHSQQYHQRSQDQPEKYAANKHSREEPQHKLVCQICRQLVSKRYAKFIRNLPDSGKPICPALVQGENEGFPVCSSCYATLVARWESAEESRQVPPKHYPSSHQSETNSSKIAPVTNSSDIHRNGGSHVNLDMALRIKVPTPDHDIIRLHQSQHPHSSGATLLTTIPNRPASPVNLSYGHIHPEDSMPPAVPPSSMTTSSSHLNALDLSGSSRSALVPLETSTVVKKSRRNSSLPENYFVCYVCSSHIKSGRSYKIHSYPIKSKDRIDSRPKPFFPFLTPHLASSDAEPIAEDGTVITCTFCYHSLMEQWLAYESSTSKHPQDRNPWSRQFNTTDYVCYVCGITTNRKRVDSIRVIDFPFILEHPKPSACLILDGGEAVVVCLVCYETIISQWQEFERMKVPIEARRYNCIATSTSPNDGTKRHTANGEHVSEHRHSVRSEEEMDDNRHRDGSVRHHQPGLGHSSKTSVQVTQASSGKNSGNMIAVPPPHHAQISPSGTSGIQTHNTNARTSSFAAALRKLAEQATDPVTDKELSPVSPANSPAPTSTPKRGPPSLVLMNDSHSSSHSSTAASHIPPVNYSSSPTATMTSNQHYVESRKSSERPVIVHSRGSSKGLYDDSKKSSYSSHRPHGDPGPEDSNRSGSTSLSRGCPPPLYGDRVDVNASPAKSTPSSYLSSHQPSDTKGGGSGYYGDRGREESGYLSTRPPPSQPLRLLSPSWAHHTPTSASSRIDDHINVNSSFQPYRPSPEDLRHGISPHIPSTYDSTSPFGYHPAAFLPPQLQHPSFRFDDPMYLERCSMFRPPLFSLPHPGVLPPHHALTFFSGSRYAPDILPHPLGLVSPNGSQLLAQESRLKLEEQRRERSYEVFDQERSRGREREHERETDYINGAVNGKEQEKRQRNSWSLGSTTESPGAGSVGSITQGIPRTDLVSRASPVRPMMPSPSPSRLASAGSSMELPTGHVSRRSKSPNEFLDRNDGGVSYPNSYSKTFLPSSYSREKSPSVEREQYMPRISNYETGYYENSDANSISRKTSRTSDSRLKDAVVYNNSVSRHYSVPENNYVKNKVYEVSQSNYETDALRANVSTVAQLHSDDVRVKKRPPVSFHSTCSKASDGISGKMVDVETRDASVIVHNVEEVETVNSWDSYLRLNLVTSRQPAKLDKCDQVASTAKVFQEPVCDNIKSKLDLAAERAKLRRLNNLEECSDDDDDDDDDVNNSKSIYQNLTIYSGPPLPLDTSKQKLQFLSCVGLTTHKRKREMDFDRFLKQQRFYNYTCEIIIEKNVPKEKSVPWFLNALAPQKYDPNELRREPGLAKKVQFFLNLNLDLVPSNKREDNKRILQAVIDENLRRNGYAVPSHSNALPSTVKTITSSSTNSHSPTDVNPSRNLKRKREGDVSECEQSQIKLGVNSKCRPSAVCNIQTGQLNRQGDIDHSSAILNSTQGNQLVETRITDVVNNQYKKYGRDFAQEFHESVLLQTRAVNKRCNSEVENMTGSRNIITDGTSSPSNMESSVESQSAWPGIEMLMTAYQKHQQEQKLERDVLSEQCSRLLAQNRELNNVAEKLSQKTAEYISLRKGLNEERQCLHQAIDNLKCFLKDLR